MLRGIYSAATGMETAGRSTEITSHNIAHGIEPGYRERGVVFEAFENVLARTTGDAPPDLIGAQVARGYSVFKPGPVVFTGNPLDVALDGDAFFSVQGPEGPLYTRDGVFQRAPDGRLVSTGNLPVLGVRGPITIPPQASSITVAADGTVAADNVAVDRLLTTRFTNPDRLDPAGTALFRDPGEAGQAPANPRVIQGYREGSNVNLPGSMVSLIRENRYYEASQRALRTLSESLAQVTRPQ